MNRKGRVMKNISREHVLYFCCYGGLYVTKTRCFDSFWDLIKWARFSPHCTASHLREMQG